MAEAISEFFATIGDFFGDLWSTIVRWLLDGLFWLCEVLFGWINLPDFPSGLTGSIDSFLDLVFDNLSLLGFFIRPSTLKVVIPILIILINFEWIYHLTMWIVKKIPFFNVKQVFL